MRSLSTTYHLLAAAAVTALWLGLLATGYARTAAAAPQTALIARGSYLANQVAMCGDCHTPRLPNGAPDLRRHLQGCDLDMVPKRPIPGWVGHAPDISARALRGISADQLAGMLEGKVRLAPPMPAYHMRHEDALAVATYLKSVDPTVRRP